MRYAPQYDAGYETEADLDEAVSSLMYAKVLNGDLDDDENEWDLDLGEDDLALLH